MKLAKMRGSWLATIVVVSIGCASSLLAQRAGAVLSGKVTSASGSAIASATVAVKSAVTGTSAETQTDMAGAYAFKALAPGAYEVTVSAAGSAPQTRNVTVTAAATQTLDFSLAAGTQPSLTDLGFPASATQPNPQEQARLDKRSHMLQIHQRLGLITTVPLVATVITGAYAGGRSTSTADRNLHAALGTVTAGLYFATAYYAIAAPKIPGTRSEGNIRLHRAMAWIHGPGMILTPILGAMAYRQKSAGEKVHGIAKAHGEVAIVTTAAYGVAILSVSLQSGPVTRSAHRIAGILHLGRSATVAASGGAAQR